MHEKNIATPPYLYLVTNRSSSDVVDDLGQTLKVTLVTEKHTIGQNLKI